MNVSLPYIGLIGFVTKPSTGGAPAPSQVLVVMMTLPSPVYAVLS